MVVPGAKPDQVDLEPQKQSDFILFIMFELHLQLVFVLWLY